MEARCDPQDLHAIDDSRGCDWPSYCWPVARFGRGGPHRQLAHQPGGGPVRVTRDCDAAFEQSGDHVDGTFDCGDDGPGTLSGTLTESAQGATIEATLSLVSGAATINATATLAVSGDGNSISGTWESGFLGGLTGTFDGERLAFPKGDLNCDNTLDGRDVLVVLTYLSGGEAIQGPACPSLGSGVVLIFGDMDCNAAVGILDGRFILLYWGGVSFELPDSCAPIGL